MSAKSKAAKALGVIGRPRRTTNPDAFSRTAPDAMDSVSDKTIARTNSPTSFTAMAEGKSLAQLSIAIRKLEAKDSLSADEKGMLGAFKKAKKNIEKKQASEVPRKSERPKGKKQPSKPDMSMAMNKGGYANCGASVPGTQSKK
jgi:hypothetical protein